jgi:hypothetical protein
MGFVMSSNILSEFSDYVLNLESSVMQLSEILLAVMDKNSDDAKVVAYNVATILGRICSFHKGGNYDSTMIKKMIEKFNGL